VLAFGENVLFAAVLEVAFHEAFIPGVIEDIAYCASIPGSAATARDPFGIEVVGDSLEGSS